MKTLKTLPKKLIAAKRRAKAEVKVAARCVEQIDWFAFEVKHFDSLSDTLFNPIY
jgi:hypothetical protein